MMGSSDVARPSALGDGLVFVISQPRSGSTLLQSILGSHSDIHTVPEPWMMLHFVYALREEGLEAEYDARLARMAMVDFLEAIGGRGTYIDMVRKASSELYRLSLIHI